VDIDLTNVASIDLLLSAEVFHLQERGVAVDGLDQVVLSLLAVASSLVVGSFEVISLLGLFEVDLIRLSVLVSSGLLESKGGVLLGLEVAVVHVYLLELLLGGLLFVEESILELTCVSPLGDLALFDEVVLVSEALSVIESDLILDSLYLLRAVSLLVSKLVSKSSFGELVLSLFSLDGSFKLLGLFVLSLEVSEERLGADSHILDVDTLEPHAPVLEHRSKLRLNLVGEEVTVFNDIVELVVSNHMTADSLSKSCDLLMSLDRVLVFNVSPEVHVGSGRAISFSEDSPGESSLDI